MAADSSGRTGGHRPRALAAHLPLTNLDDRSRQAFAATISFETLFIKFILRGLERWQRLHKLPHARHRVVTLV